MFAVYLFGGYLNIRDKRQDNEIYKQQILPYVTVQPGDDPVAMAIAPKYVIPTEVTPVDYDESFQMSKAEQAARAAAGVIKMEELRQRRASRASRA